MKNVTAGGTVKRLSEKQADAISRRDAGEALHEYISRYLKAFAPEEWYAISAADSEENDSRHALLLRFREAVEQALSTTVT